jgi:nitric oxide synthase oxygenase domain/subunit
LGFKDARTANRALRDVGLQIKINGEWVPTEKGASLCVRHAWTAGNKSGYNLKWRVVSVREMVVGECH